MWSTSGRVAWPPTWAGSPSPSGATLFNMIMTFTVYKHDIEITCIIPYTSLPLSKSHVSSYFPCFILLSFILQEFTCIKNE